MDETADAYYLLGFTVEDYWRVLYNMIYRFGAIYDRVWEIGMIFYLNMVDVLEAPEWVYLGGLFGKIFFEIFRPEYYPEIVIVWPEEL